MCRFLTALFLLVAIFLRCGREIDAAMRVTMRRATPQTAEHVFACVLLEKIEKRLNRREADKLRKRRARNLAAAFGDVTPRSVAHRLRPTCRAPLFRLSSSSAASIEPSSAFGLGTSPIALCRCRALPFRRSPAPSGLTPDGLTLAPGCAAIERPHALPVPTSRKA
jgi:hypothetical protein